MTGRRLAIGAARQPGRSLLLALSAALVSSCGTASSEQQGGVDLEQESPIDRGSWRAIARCRDGAVGLSGEGPDGDDYAGYVGLRAPEHTYGTIWACRSGGRELTVKADFQAGSMGECGLCARGRVSAWVDGVKVIQGERAGHPPMGSYQEEPVVNRIALTSEGTLVVCRTFAWEDLDNPDRRCSRTSITELRGETDPDFIGSVAHDAGFRAAVFPISALPDADLGVEALHGGRGRQLPTRYRSGGARLGPATRRRGAAHRRLRRGQRRGHRRRAARAETAR